MSDPTLQMLGEIQRSQGRMEGKIEGLEKSVDELKDQVEKGRAEASSMRNAIAEAASKFDPETGMLKPQFLEQPKPLPEVQAQAVAESKERTKLWSHIGKFFAVITGLATAGWAVITGAK